MIEKIEHAALLYAIIVRAEFKQEGIEFFTENEYAIQMGYMNREKGYTIARHKHKQIDTISIEGINQEILMIRKGRMKVDLFDVKDEFISSITLHTGDLILFFRGGHGFEMLEATDFIEIKQGPFGGPLEKILF